ncbi:methyltransferase type 11 [Vagococcus fluvialis]|uniref:glycosyltransferase WbsX family protein n=1 Tax=Vagococcus fluvialis TaxID=2738 RepID=UPI001432A06F|nr:glycoside hydrolase family 99-like domain-containing protein [Vagococcus fluvialis]NKC59755.1 methyltransferase type 11 [Vagococcus fluvialis]NKD50652.1 methyltransferase type 11 [Vagococcus fluvialis]
MKLIAYYLPQFHEIQENNEWWGEGFTEWDNVKKAKPLFKNHRQPIEPEQYYNLMEKEVVEHQTELMNESGIYGFCYYHYWFSGRKILEKPAENLLRWKNINQKFMFCWANHSWKKTWNGTNEILINQEYGNLEEWEDHINYLLPFFKDERYIKVDDKPVIMLYSARDIPNLNERIEFYNRKCLEEGFSGIYIIESLNSVKSKKISKQSSAVVLREPAVALSNQNKMKKILRYITSRPQKNYLYLVTKYKYSKIIEDSIYYAKYMKEEGEGKVYLGAFTGWDSTPRHIRRGYVIQNNKKNSFKNYLLSLKEISSEDDLLFINAWNEWSEGMILEPERNSKINLLEEVKEFYNECKI